MPTIESTDNEGEKSINISTSQYNNTDITDLVTKTKRKKKMTIYSSDEDELRKINPTVANDGDDLVKRQKKKIRSSDEDQNHTIPNLVDKKREPF